MGKVGLFDELHVILHMILEDVKLNQIKIK